MIIQDGKMYMVRGDDESFEATITDDSGAAYEMQDGDVLVFTVRGAANAESPVLIQIESMSGSSTIVIAHDDTAEIPVGAYSADLQLITAGGLRKTVWPQLSMDNSDLSTGNMRNFILAREVTMI